MGEYIDIGGHDTWVETQGDGQETVLFLHGGLSNTDDLLGSIGAPIAERYRVVAFDRRGHGRTADRDAAFHYDEMATETIGVLEKVVQGPAHLVGWSDGGIVALIVAQRRPDLVGKIVPIGANFHYNGMRHMDIDPEGPVAGLLASGYAERSPDGPEHFGAVMEKAFTLFATEPTMTADDLKGITAPTMVLVGDDDMIEYSHTVEMFEALPAGQLAVIPGASHVLPLEKPAETARVILDFLGEAAPPQTLMPSRRSAG